MQAWQPSQLVLEDYRVERTIGIGGMGHVYLLRNLTTGTHFAVKRSRVGGPDARRRFLSELAIWFGLPDYRHFAGCQFFRTIDDEIVLFAEYVAGGSLADAIAGSRIESVGEIVDIAIQTAWALHALHTLAIVHRDVKPSNILLGSDHVAKLTDFGLATARATVPGSSASQPVSQGTFAYSSPEQLRGGPVTAASDVWSWGLSVLEMFTGGVTWCSGAAAPLVLDDYSRSQSSSGTLTLPGDFADVLARCFSTDPRERWDRLDEVAARLIRLFRTETRHEYRRRPPIPLAPAIQEYPIHARDSILGVAWDDPRDWLARALQLQGKDPNDVDRHLLERRGTRKAQGIADLAAFEQAHQLFTELVTAGRATDRQLAELRVEKALLHVNLDDIGGALTLLDRAIAGYESLGVLQSEPDAMRARLNRALLFKELHFLERARDEFERLSALMEEVPPAPDDPDLVNDVAKLYHNLANVADDLGDTQRAIETNAKAIAIRQELLSQYQSVDYVRSLAESLTNHGTYYSRTGDPALARRYTEQALDRFRQIVDVPRLRGPVVALAAALLNLANRVSDTHRAAVLCEEAVTLLSRLTTEHGAREYETMLATAYHNWAAALIAQAGEMRSADLVHRALDANGAGLEILQRLVFEDGRSDLMADLVREYHVKAVFLGVVKPPDLSVPEDAPSPDDPAVEPKNDAHMLEAHGDFLGAAILFGDAVERYRPVVDEARLSGPIGRLAVTLINRAPNLVLIDRIEDAARDCEEARRLLGRLAARDGVRTVVAYLDQLERIEHFVRARQRINQ